MENLKMMIADEIIQLSKEKVWVSSNWDRLIKKTISEYLKITFNLKRNPSKKTQIHLVDIMSAKQQKELGSIVDEIQRFMVMSIASSEKVRD